MKKLTYFLLLLISILFVNMKIVNAEVLDVNDVASTFEKTPFMETLKNLEISGSAKVDANNKTLDVYFDDEKVFSLTYGVDYIEYDKRSEIPTEENVNETFGEMLSLYGVMESILVLSGYEGKTINEDAEFNSYDTYGIQVETEEYNFSGTDEDGGTWTMSGNFLKYFKMSLNTEKIAALMEKYGKDVDYNEHFGYSEEIYELVPTISFEDITENSVVVYTSLTSEEVEVPEDVMCDIYRSTDKDGEYQKISEWSVNCSGGIGVTDEGLNENTTYYYKAVVMGGENFSEPISVTTKSKEVVAIPENKKDEIVENPKTGIFTNALFVGIGVLASGVICYYLKKKNIIKKI